MDTLADASRAATARLTDSDSPQLDAELLLAHVLGADRSHLRAHPEARLDASQAQRYAELVEARRRGEPIAYLTGEREFWSLRLKVTPATLIPRPETELLVEQALALIPAGADWQIADLGTGSGAIALAIAKERPRCRVSAVDVSADALAVARDNAQRLHIANLEFLEGDWFAPLAARRFQMIVSNPPYVSIGDPHLAKGDLRFEPARALSSGGDGLEDIRRIAASAPAHLQPDGYLLLEHGFEQAASVRELLQGSGFTDARSVRDLGSHERISLGRHAKSGMAR
ncbi:MAG TPA: peptide chain release factor N(5)-glutamine methyltransferase [Gammaproteobacteria bacterium]|jgi:release factor glutamine methyltransferase